MSGRKFDAKPAERRDVCLAIGLVAPPGAGKTWSALRLAAGIQKVRGGDIIVIDTDFGRASHYADYFKFKHVNFEPPFRPTDFLAAVQQFDLPTTAAIIVDNMSDEHEGTGGVLEWHDEELDRMAGNDFSKRERCSQAAWIKPKQSREKMRRGLGRIKTPVIYTFRAKEKTEQRKNDRGKMEPVKIGWMPIAPIELVFGMTITCIIPPNGKGVPIWHSDKVGEDFIIKMPEQFKKMFSDGQTLTEEHGRLMAEWARGGTKRQEASTAVDAAPADPISLETLDFALAQCDTVEDLRTTWVTNEKGIDKAQLLDAQAMYKVHLKRVKESTASP
ncbi:ATP-binding protein [Sphingomonas sp.]|jgi:hypothetical protein|uniref:ATP-binding protein n=1 Tax=Sphingomonas sp. TaxID=28214 RepID=UPI0035677BF9